MFEIKEITDANEKSSICRSILAQLNDWFSIDESNREHIENVRKLTFYAAYHEGEPIGYTALKRHNSYTVEIYIIGVLPRYHRQGAGRLLIARCEEYCRDSAAEFLTVKTLDASAESEAYDRTRRFYESIGFRPLEVMPLYWNEENPCLLLVKHIGHAKTIAL